MRPLCFATASPARRQLLADTGFSFRSACADIDETIIPGESVDAYVRRLACAKSRAILPQAPDEIMIAADTVVVCDGKIMGKPRDQSDAQRTLEHLSGKWHEVVTGIALRDAQTDDVLSEVAVTRVCFHPLSPATIAWYLATQEWQGKAGAYAVQGEGRALIAEVDGDETNVVGLPMPIFRKMLQQWC